MFVIPASSLQLIWTSCRRGYMIIWRPLNSSCERHNFALSSTLRQSRSYPDIPWPDAPVIYTGAFPILTAWPGRRSIYNSILIWNKNNYIKVVQNCFKCYLNQICWIHWWDSNSYYYVVLMWFRDSTNKTTSSLLAETWMPKLGKTETTNSAYTTRQTEMDNISKISR